MKNFLRILSVLSFAVALVAHATSYKETTLATFRGQTGPNSPSSHLVADSAGNLYGTTLWGGGGCKGQGCGSVYKLTPSSTGYTEQVIYAFKGIPDVENPTSILIDSSGNLYGTSFTGGAYNSGTVWELSPSGSTWTETILYSFGGYSGDTGSAASLVTDGTNFYGVGEGGAAYTDGAVFELSPSASGWTESILYSFTGGKDGGGPDSLTMDTAGNLYGATVAEGDSTCSGLFGTGCGTVFSLQPSSGSWVLHLLYTFHGTKGPNGAQPFGGVVLDASGNLYGATYAGGINEQGVVYELSPTSVGEWTLSVLHRFTNGTDGSEPTGGLTIDRAGNIYGAADGQLATSPSSVFRLSKSSTGGWIFATIYPFGDGANAAAPSYFDTSGNLYGTTGLGQGTVYELTRP
jgi:uncharacterized repeat protein (TIGR03803 family)